MALKIYWYETGVLSTAKSAAAKARSAATKTAATAQRAAANQAQAQARQGSGKSAAQNKAEFEASQRPGRNLSISFDERLSFSDQTKTATVFHRDVGSTQRQGSSSTPSPTTQGQVIKRQVGGGVPAEALPLGGPPSGRNLSVELKEDLRFSSERERPSGAIAPYGGSFLAGAETIARLRKDTEEERRQRDLVTQVSVGAAEGLGGLGASITAFGIASAKELEGLVKGKGFGQSKEFVEFVKGELRPSTVSQAFSQIDPFAKERQPISFDPTSLSRGAGELASFAFGGGTVKVTGARGLPRTPGEFTSTKIPMGEKGIETYPLISPPYKSIYEPQLTSRIKLGAGIGKMKLREPTPRRSPFMEDKAGPSSGAKLFGETKINLGKGTTQSISRTQRQSSGLQTILKQKTIQKAEPDILFSKPRFEQSQYKKSAGGYVTETIQYPKSAPATITQGLQTKHPQTQNDVMRDLQKAITPPKTQQRVEPRLRTILGRGQVSKEKFGFKDELTLLVARPIKEKFGFRDDLTFKQGLGSRESFKFREDLTTKLTPGQRTEPPYRPPPRETILRPPGFAGFIPKTYLSSFGFKESESTKTIFEAYGISSDINIKTLPTFQRVGKTSKVFKQQEKEDKRIQNLLYGIKTRKTKKAKSKKRKRK